MIICYKCKNNKELVCFSKDKSRGNGYSPICKICKKEQRKIWEKENIKNSVIPDNKKCNNCSKMLPKSEFHKKKGSKDGLHTYCKICKKQKRISNKKSNIKLFDNYEKVCRNCNKKKSKDDFYKLSVSKDKLNTWCKICSSKRLVNYTKTRKKTDPGYKILINLRCRVYETIVKSKKTHTTKTLIGCSVDYFKKWIEWQFNSKMSWDNYGTYWNIDHVKACTLFDLTIIDNQFKCFSWKNSRPLNIKDNIDKSNKYLPREILIQELKVYQYIKYATHLEAGNPLEPLLPFIIRKSNKEHC